MSQLMIIVPYRICSFLVYNYILYYFDVALIDLIVSLIEEFNISTIVVNDCTDTVLLLVELDFVVVVQFFLVFVVVIHLRVVVASVQLHLGVVIGVIVVLFPFVVVSEGFSEENDDDENGNDVVSFIVVVVVETFKLTK